jgi:valyl-tRNA synthetase
LEWLKGITPTSLSSKHLKLMELATTYSPQEAESKWYQFWLENNFFHAEVAQDKEPYTIVIPPPNVTGVLHMGHMLNNTIQDVLIRKARMEGKSACWVPGTDHASIATEAKVVRMLREKGIRKADLTREQFLEYAWEWKEKYGGIILEQLKKLGASCDWERTHFTMDKGYYQAVIRTFVDLYKKGYIYRGLRMINWDCEAQTALSNEEVLYNEDGERSVLYHTQYQIEETGEWITIATQRPETIWGDTAIAVNPTDERYQHLIGKFATVPLTSRKIPIIGDEYVEKEFGTGCLKVTPAHDINDYEIGLRHHLPVLDTINPDGTMNDKGQMPAELIGKDRFVARKIAVKLLKEAGYILKEEEFTTKIGRSERTGTVVEPKLSWQWFIKMKEISRRALQAVEDDEVILHPAKFKNTYRHWMENVRDWCISRQLWWGHRIPAYYFGSGQEDFVVAETPEEALLLAREKAANPALGLEDLRQDEDVLDTWASSWLWPLAVFNGFDDAYFNKDTGKIEIEKNAELNYFYPTEVLVTAPEILFFWVARMIIAGYEYVDKKPFKNVYLTGIVRDKQGRKMSKSLGNSPDPLDLIARYSADSVRVGLLFSSPAGNDLPFDEKLCEQGRNFANKIWNAYRLTQGWQKVEKEIDAKNELALLWFEAKIHKTLQDLEHLYSQFRISEALLTIYKLIWDDFCSQYLEMIKPPFGEPIDRITYEKTLAHFEVLLKILHPFMPFLSEELWQAIAPRTPQAALIVSAYPKAADFQPNEKLLARAEQIFEVISNIRHIRNQKQIAPKQPLDLHIKSGRMSAFVDFIGIIQKLANVDKVIFAQKKPEKAVSFVVKSDEFFVPLEGHIDVEAEKETLLKELERTKGFLHSVLQKLSNEKFVSNASPQVVERERKKQADAEAKIRALQEQLAAL